MSERYGAVQPLGFTASAISHSVILWRAFEDKLLNSIIIVALTGIQVSVGIQRDVIKIVELAWAITFMAELSSYGAIQAIKDPHHGVLAICNQEILLFWIMGKRQLPNGSSTSCLWRDPEFLQEVTVFRKDLDPVGDAISYVDKTVI